MSQRRNINNGKGGKEVSIFVDAKVLAKSPHKNLSCVSCHVGFDPDAMPHKEKIEPVSCVSCHNNAPVKHLFPSANAEQTC